MRSAPRMATPAALVLAALAVAVLAAPMLVPGDGLRWRPARGGLYVTRVVENRDLGVGPGARIVSVNAAPWREAELLRHPYSPPAWGARAQYVFHDAGFAKNRIVELRTLAPAAALKGYARQACLLLVLAALAAWGTRRDPDAAAALMAGLGVAAYTLGNVSPLALTAFGLRHLETAAACWSAAGALVLSRAARRGHPVAWVAGALALGGGLWLAAPDRWVWWRTALALCAMEFVAALAAVLVFHGQQNHQQQRQEPKQDRHAHS
jgi:hypothetical protein